MAYVSMKQMLETGVHFGHQTCRWNPKMKPYIFGARNGIHIIDLQQTVKLYRTAHDKVTDTVAKGGRVVFIGTKRQAQEAIATEASRAGQFYVDNRWMGGTLTNFSTIQKSIERMKKLEAMFADGTINRYQKKEVLILQRELDKLKLVIGGIQDMERLPQLAFIIDPHREIIAVQECRKLGIPIVAVTDTNCDPDPVDYIIPGNDDAIRAIKLFVGHIADACLEGEAMRKDGGKDKNPEEMFAKAAAAEAAPEVKTVVHEAAATEVKPVAPEVKTVAHEVKTVAHEAAATEAAPEVKTVAHEVAATEAAPEVKTVAHEVAATEAAPEVKTVAHEVAATEAAPEVKTVAHEVAATEEKAVTETEVIV